MLPFHVIHTNMRRTQSEPTQLCQNQTENTTEDKANLSVNKTEDSYKSKDDQNVGKSITAHQELQKLAMGNMPRSTNKRKGVKTLVKIDSASKSHFGDVFNITTNFNGETPPPEPNRNLIRSLSCQVPSTTLKTNTLEKPSIRISRQSLKSFYGRSDAYMSSYLWKGEGCNYSIKDYYQPLQIEEEDLHGYKTIKELQLENIFDNSEQNRKILVTGNPGAGKTTLFKRIAYEWSSDNPPRYLARFEFLVIIPLRELGDRTVTQAISEIIFKKNKLVFSSLEEEGMKLLIILDGFDELSKSDKVVKFLKHDSDQTLMDMTMMVGSRPHAVEEIRKEFGRRIRITGFSKSHQEAYVRNVFHREEESAKSLVAKLNDEDLFSNLSECPLMLHMLCCIHKYKTLDAINKLTDLYIEIFRLMINRYVNKFPDSVLEEGKLFTGENLLARLGKIAWRYLNQEIPFITEEELKREFPKEREYFFITRIDLFDAYPTDSGSCSMKAVTKMIVLHQTFLEFLCALYVVRLDETELLFEQLCEYGDFWFKDDEDIRYTQADFKWTYDVYDMRLVFLFGLIENGKHFQRYLRQKVPREDFFLPYDYDLLEMNRKEAHRETWNAYCKHAKFDSHDDCMQERSLKLSSGSYSIGV